MSHHLFFTLTYTYLLLPPFPPPPPMLLLLLSRAFSTTRGIDNSTNLALELKDEQEALHEEVKMTEEDKETQFFDTIRQKRDQDFQQGLLKRGLLRPAGSLKQRLAAKQAKEDMLKASFHKAI